MIKISDTEYFSNDRSIRFLQGDCNEFMAGLKDNEFDLNLSDPPYGIGVTKMNMGGRKTIKPNKIQSWDNWTPDLSWFNLCKLTADNYIIFGGNYFEWSTIYNPKLKRVVDFKKYDGIIWDKGETLLGRDFSEAEIAFTNLKNGIYKLSPNQLDRIHVTQKPIDLYRWIIQNYTKPTDTILDCFGGSMSNAIACHMERRNLTILELDQDYFKSALERFRIYESQLTLF